MDFLTHTSTEIFLVAAAVIASDKRELNYHEHVQRAMAGAKPGSLLAQNLASHFPDDMKSARLDVK